MENKEILEINKDNMYIKILKITKLNKKFSSIKNENLSNINDDINNDNSFNIINNQKLTRNKTEIFDTRKTFILTEMAKKKEYRYECININNLNGSIVKGTDDLKIGIILKNTGNIIWPVGKAKLQFDINSPIRGKEIILFPQKPGEQKTYNMNFCDLKTFDAGQYTSYILINIDDKYIGGKIKIIITIKPDSNEVKEINENIDKIKEFRKAYGLIKFFYPDEKVWEALKKNNFSFDETFESFFTN